MIRYWSVLAPVLIHIWSARADYQCLCAYSVETSVYSSPAMQGVPMGYLYEFDCKPVYQQVTSTPTMQAIQYENKVGYVDINSENEIQLCQGNVPREDKVAVPSTTLSTSPIETTQTTSPSSSPISSTLEMITKSYLLTTDTSPPFPTVLNLSSTLISFTVPITTKLSTTRSDAQTTNPSPIIKSTSALGSSTTVESTTISLSTLLPTKVDSQTVHLSTKQPISSTLTTTFVNPTNMGTRSDTAASTTTPMTTPSSATTSATTTATSMTTAPTSTLATTITTTPRPISTTTITTPTQIRTTRQPTTLSTPVTTTTTTSQTTTGKPVPKCKLGWTLWQGSCYFFHTSSRSTWNNANSACKSYGAHLVFVESSDEDVFVTNEINQHLDSHIDGDSDSGIWMGGSDKGHEGRWVWHDGVTGHETQLGYKNWRHGEPDSGDGDHDEDCMCMIAEKGYDWQDYSCEKHMFYVCEMNPVLATHAVSSGSCDNGWVAFQTSCYYIYAHHREKWQTAEASCASDVAHLAFIETQAENEFLRSILRHHVNTGDDDSSDTGVWLGGSDANTEGKWVWHNSLAGRDTQFTYTNWRPGQPDTGDHDHEEDCMCMIGNKGFVWEDYSCNEHMFYVCEKEQNRLLQPGLQTHGLHCSSGWTLYGTSCYLFSHSHHLEWDDAGGKCRDAGAYLVIINSVDEQTFLKNQLRHILGSGSDEGVWTGGTDTHHERTWVWMNTLSGREEMTLSGYTNWRSGFPHTGEDCLAMFANHGYQWEDYRCRNNLYHVCEKSAIRQMPSIIG